MTIAAAGRAILDALEARIPAPLYLGATSRLDPQPGPLPIPAAHNASLRQCRPCEVATTEPVCFVCGAPLL